MVSSCIYFFVLSKVLVVCPLDKLQELLSLTLLQECHFRLQQIVGQRQCSFMQWQRHCSKLHQPALMRGSHFYLLFNSSESFHLDIDPMETPAHVYVQSIHNIAVEHSWLHLHLELGIMRLLFSSRVETMEYTLLIFLNMHMLFSLVVIAYLMNYYRQLSRWL